MKGFEGKDENFKQEHLYTNCQLRPENIDLMDD